MIWNSFGPIWEIQPLPELREGLEALVFDEVLLPRSLDRGAEASFTDVVRGTDVAAGAAVPLILAVAVLGPADPAAELFVLAAREAGAVQATAIAIAGRAVRRIGSFAETGRGVATGGDLADGCHRWTGDRRAAAADAVPARFAGGAGVAVGAGDSVRLDGIRAEPGGRRAGSGVMALVERAARDGVRTDARASLADVSAEAAIAVAGARLAFTGGIAGAGGRVADGALTATDGCASNTIARAVTDFLAVAGVAITAGGSGRFRDLDAARAGLATSGHAGVRRGALKRCAAGTGATLARFSAVAGGAITAGGSVWHSRI